MQEKYQWLKNPDTVTKIAAAVLLIALFCGIQCFAEDFFTNTFKLAISGNVDALAEYLRSFGPWAIVISFVFQVIAIVKPDISKTSIILIS